MEQFMNEGLASQISQDDVDIDYFVDIILKEKQMRNDIVELTLNHPHIMVYYHGYYIIDKATEINQKIFIGALRPVFTSYNRTVYAPPLKRLGVPFR
jgi:hypothetical protein